MGLMVRGAVDCPDVVGGAVDCPGGLVSRSQTLYLEKQREKGLVKLPWQIGSDLTGFLRC